MKVRITFDFSKLEQKALKFSGLPSSSHGDVKLWMTSLIQSTLDEVVSEYQKQQRISDQVSRIMENMNKPLPILFDKGSMAFGVYGSRKAGEQNVRTAVSNMLHLITKRWQDMPEEVKKHIAELERKLEWMSGLDRKNVIQDSLSILNKHSHDSMKWIINKNGDFELKQRKQRLVA